MRSPRALVAFALASIVIAAGACASSTRAPAMTGSGCGSACATSCRTQCMTDEASCDSSCQGQGGAMSGGDDDKHPSSQLDPGAQCLDACRTRNASCERSCVAACPACAGP